MLSVEFYAPDFYLLKNTAQVANTGGLDLSERPSSGLYCIEMK
jgi:hypothetical protein